MTSSAGGGGDVIKGMGSNFNTPHGASVKDTLAINYTHFVYNKNEPEVRISEPEVKFKK